MGRIGKVAFLFWGLLSAAGGAEPSCSDVVARSEGDPAPAAQALIVNKCAGCHRGPYLDFSRPPFYSDTFLTERALLTESIRRAKLPQWGRMPPIQYPPLSSDEIRLLERWLGQLPAE